MRDPTRKCQKEWSSGPPMCKLIAINYTFLRYPDYALGDQLPNNKLRFSVRVNGAYRLIVSCAHCPCRVRVKGFVATNW